MISTEKRTTPYGPIRERYAKKSILIMDSILRYKFQKCFLVLFSMFCITLNAQIVPFYPVEIFFCPVGYTNSLPGCNPNLYTTFSSLKVILTKDLPYLNKISNNITFVTNIIKYHNFTQTRNYHPLSFNPTLTTHFFGSDIYTLGLDMIGDLEFLPRINYESDLNHSLIRNFNFINYRFRVRPFHYVILTPNLILQQLFTFGRSYNSHTQLRQNSDNKLQSVSNDYSIFRADLKAIYFTKFHTRLFLVPYYFKTQYFDIAINKKKLIDKKLPKLREEGFGCTIGLRYMTFTWGVAEAAFEFEKNIDKTEGGNSYIKLKFSTKWENQYFTERFGYLF